MALPISAAFSLLMLSLLSFATSNDSPLTNQTLGAAIQEMQKANYFAFVMLLNMVPSDKIPDNITFLMPNNRVLAKAVIPENDVLDFLLRHSIPSPLRFDHLSHFPTGSIIPSSEPDFALRISNSGRRSFFLNNVKLVSPDICLAGPSIRCHGIDGVLVAGADKTPPLPNDAPPVTTAPSPALPPREPPSPVVGPAGGSFNLAPAATPQPAGSGQRPKKSGCSRLGASGASLTVGLLWVLLSIFHS